MSECVAPDGLNHLINEQNLFVKIILVKSGATHFWIGRRLRYIMPSFEFATANRVMFGAGKMNELGSQLKGRTKRLLLVRGNGCGTGMTGTTTDILPYKIQRDLKWADIR